MSKTNGNIAEHSTQYIDNMGFNSDTKLKSVEIGGTDGVSVNRLKVNSDGSLNIAGLVPEKHDEVAITYVTSGNGVGEIETVVYKLASATIATLTLSYNADNKLSGVVRT